MTPRPGVEVTAENVAALEADGTVVAHDGDTGHFDFLHGHWWRHSPSSSHVLAADRSMVIGARVLRVGASYDTGPDEWEYRAAGTWWGSETMALSHAREYASRHRGWVERRRVVPEQPWEKCDD